LRPPRCSLFVHPSHRRRHVYPGYPESLEWAFPPGEAERNISHSCDRVALPVHPRRSFTSTTRIGAPPRWLLNSPSHEPAGSPLSSCDRVPWSSGFPRPPVSPRAGRRTRGSFINALSPPYRRRLREQPSTACRHWPSSALLLPFLSYHDRMRSSFGDCPLESSLVVKSPDEPVRSLCSGASRFFQNILPPLS